MYGSDKGLKNFLKMRRRIGKIARRKPIEFKQILPNMVTSGNLLCGLFSLMMVLNERYVVAAWLVFFAVIFDGFDGKVARMLGGGSQFGLEFDSLADLVSFGVAPAILMYQVSVRELHLIGAVTACFFALSVALRLARFNIVHVPGPVQGLPCPAGGLFVVSFVIAGVNLPSPVTAIIMMSVGGLMISSIPYANMKKLTKKTADPAKCLALFSLFILSFVFMKKSAPLFLFAMYIVSGLIHFDWGQWILKPEARELKKS